MDNTVSIITLGCKVNKYESESLSRMLEEAGFVVTEELAMSKFYIINTCAVTNEAEKKSRQYIAKINKINPNSQIIICGCGSEKNKEEYLKKKNVVAVFNNQRKDLIINYLKNEIVKDEPLSCFNETLTGPKVNQARAYIKIQDGCNRFCSYCIIPYVRGRSVSRSLDSIVKEATDLSNNYSEIVIVGIDMSDYKINNELALPLLMSKLSKIPARIRLGSLEVSVITRDFMEILKNMHNFAPQFHLSLQSGDDDILKKMNRKYTSKDYLSAVELIYTYFPDANITTDIIVGFPYETEENFQNTLNLAKKVRFGKIHCFPFSAKKGTIAYKFPEVNAKIKKERMERLEKLALDLQQKYNKQFLNKQLNLLIEEIEDGYYTGYTENYIKCYYKTSDVLEIGKIIQVKPIKLFKDGMEVE